VAILATATKAVTIAADTTGEAGVRGLGVLTGPVVGSICE
jgi:hypothetical protein